MLIDELRRSMTKVVDSNVQEDLHLSSDALNRSWFWFWFWFWWGY